MIQVLGALRETIAALDSFKAYILVFGAGVLSFLLVVILTPIVIRLALEWRWVAEPSEDRWHSKPTAMMGGIGIFLGIILTLSVFVEARPLLFPAVGAVVMFGTGFVDDRVGLRPVLKFILELLAASLFILSGWRFDFGGSEVLSVGITVFWVLGITNAVNLVDNMDGLSSGITGIAALSLTVIAIMAGAGSLAVIALAVAGAAGGFLIYNFKPAKIFMGDSGSLFLGFSLAAIAVMVQTELGMSGITAVVMTAFVLGVPILDTVLVTVTRTLHNRPVSQGGRDHTSHRLVHAGLSEKQAVVLLYCMSAFFAVLAPAFYAADIRLRVSMAIFALIGAAVFAGQIGSADVYGEKTDAQDGQNGKRRSLLSVFLLLPRRILGPAWKPVLAILADVLICTGSFVLSHHLRFETALTPSQERFLLMSLPLLLVIRIPIFSAFGFYRAIWRYAGALDIARVMAAVTLTSILAYFGLGFLHGFDAVSRGVIVIDWMAVTLGILFSRFGFRGLRSYLSALSSTGRAVAVYGADEAGVEVIRMLRANGHLLKPVVILDIHKDLDGKHIHGVPIVCGIEKIIELKRKDRVKELIIPDHGINELEKEKILKICNSLGISYRFL